MSGWVDLHNHLIPGVDDGARDAVETVAAAAALYAEGVRTVVTTPHVDGSLTLKPARLARRLTELDEGWGRLTAAVDHGMVRVERGVELRLDVPEVDLSDERLRLGGSRAVLVEFPYMTVPPRSPHAIAAIRRAGYVPLLAHPERYTGVDPSLRSVRTWLDAGAYLQVNAGSFRGRYGKEARRLAVELLERGWVHCIASDYHARGEPGLAEMRELLESWGGEEEAWLLFEENPARLLRDEECLAVAPLTRRTGFGQRLRKILPWT